MATNMITASATDIPSKLRTMCFVQVDALANFLAKLAPTNPQINNFVQISAQQQSMGNDDILRQLAQAFGPKQHHLLQRDLGGFLQHNTFFSHLGMSIDIKQLNETLTSFFIDLLFIVSQMTGLYMFILMQGHGLSHATQTFLGNLANLKMQDSAASLNSVMELLDADTLIRLAGTEQVKGLLGGLKQVCSNIPSFTTN